MKKDNLYVRVILLVTTAAPAKSLQSCPTLCDPIDGSPPGSPIPGILQARTLEWVAISFSNAWKWKVKVKSLSRVRLLATPWTTSHQAPPSMGFSRQECWSGVPLPSPLNHHYLIVFSSRTREDEKDNLTTKTFREREKKKTFFSFCKLVIMFPCELIFANVLNKCRVKINHISLCLKKREFFIIDLSSRTCILLMSIKWRWYSREASGRREGQNKRALICQFITRFLATLWNVKDLSSPARDWSWATAMKAQSANH